MIVFPNAKINLGLNVVSRRADGYHNLETVFFPIPLEDSLEVVAKEHPDDGQDVSLQVSGIPVAGSVEDNLVVKAYRLLQARFPDRLTPIQIYMHKGIPSGAGLGGGSSDAAFMLRLLRDLYTLPLTDEELEADAARLGADCAFFIQNRPVFATGIGNIFSPLPCDLSRTLKGYRLLLVKPNIFVSTREAFALIRPHAPLRPLTEIVSLPVSEWEVAGMTNDFEESVFAQYPAIADIKVRLRSLGADYAAMSGSGSSLFALFAPSACLPSQSTLEQEFPSCFCRVMEL